MGIFGDIKCYALKWNTLTGQLWLLLAGAKKAGKINNYEECLGVVSDVGRLRDLLEQQGLGEVAEAAPLMQPTGECACKDIFGGIHASTRPPSEWHPWAALKAPEYPIAGDVGATYYFEPFDLHVDLHARASDNRWIQKWWTGNQWTGWQPHTDGSLLGNTPTIVTLGFSRHIFATDPGGLTYHNYSAGAAWTGWQPLGGPPMTGKIGVALPGSDTIDLYARGPGGELWQNYFDGHQWSNWFSHKDRYGDKFRLGSSPAAASGLPAHRGVYATERTSNRVFQKYYWQGNWSGWTFMNGEIIGDVSATVPYANRIELYGRALDNELWQNTSEGAGFTGWVSHQDGFKMHGSPTVISFGPDFRHVFAMGEGGVLWQKYWGPR